MTGALAQAMKRHGVSMVAEYVEQTQDADGWEHDEWSCTFRKQGEQGSITFPYRMGLGHEQREPDPERVMECLLTDALSVEAEPFEVWCADLGYDPDSRRAEKVYRACQRIRSRLRGYVGATVLDDLNAALYENRNS